MPVQVAAFSEALIAQITHERFFRRVGRLVTVQIAAPFERVPALIADIGPFFRMNLFMAVQI